MSDAPVLFEELPGHAGHLGLITLNRPQALNALTHEMVVLMHQQLLHWAENSHIKAVVIRATEGRAFCAGGDLRLAYENYKTNTPALAQFFCDEYRLNHYIYHYPKPYLAFLDGITMGGGAGISLHGSHRIGTERLLFAMPETGIGFFPDVGGSYFLSRLPQGIGFYLGLSGHRLSPDDCLGLGLIDYNIPHEQLTAVLSALCDADFGIQAKDRVNQILQAFHQPTRVAPLMSRAQLIQEHFMKPSMEDIMTSLEGSQDHWCKETAALLKTKSPTSLKVTLRQLQRGLQQNFDQCMQLEYHLMTHFTQGHDFFEGIRALLIEKDQRPQWQPAELKAINEAMIESYFMPLPGKTAPLSFA